MSTINNTIYDVAIIGGGAAGLFCAVQLKIKSPELSVVILEKQEKAGRKLLATGNGRCNMTNLYANPDVYHGSFNKGVCQLLELCPPEMTISLFESLGLLTTSDSEGRVYPYSKQSASVLQVLLNACRKYGVNIIYDYEVTDIKVNKDIFSVKSGENIISAKKVVISSGSRSTPETGADDSLLVILSNLGHSLIKPVPSLCPVFVNKSYMKQLKGVRASGRASILQNDKIMKTEQGEIQFTDKALSGICVFNLSRIANSAENTAISIELLPHLQFSEIFDMLKRKKETLCNDSTASELFTGIFNKSLGTALLKEAEIPLTVPMQKLNDIKLKKLSAIINNLVFPVIKGDDFSRSQVTAGGISGAEIDETTMESKKIKNLYIIGEAVDCDGDCGGYNLQFAFSSAYCAACEISK